MAPPICLDQQLRIYRLSSARCTLNVSYGCTADGRSVWVASGCRGRFWVSGYALECGFAGTPARCALPIAINYSQYHVQVRSDLCAPLPDGVAAWRYPADLNHSAWRRGNTSICPEAEACWLASSRRQHTSSTSRASSGDLASLVTLFYSSSARPSDAHWPNMLIDALSATRRTMGLHTSPVVVVFDGLACKPGLTPFMIDAYNQKIRLVQHALHLAHVAHDAPYTVLLHEFWLFKAEAMRRALQLAEWTPLVFVSEDDRAIDGGRVDTATIVHHLLAADGLVQSVQFSAWHDACEPCRSLSTRTDAASLQLAVQIDTAAISAISDPAAKAYLTAKLNFFKWQKSMLSGPAPHVPAVPNTTASVASLAIYHRAKQVRNAQERPSCCLLGANRCTQFMASRAPCTPHTATRLLTKITSHSDDPQLARREYFTERVFDVIAPNTRTTMEFCAWVSLRDAHLGGDWGIWLYGEPGDMKRNIHLVPMGEGSSYGAGTGNHRIIDNAKGKQADGPMNVATTFAHEPPGR